MSRPPLLHSEGTALDVLVLTTAADGRVVLPALDLLPHVVHTAAPSVAAFLSAPTCDVALVDGRTQPRAAAALAELLTATDRGIPVVAVVAEAVLEAVPDAVSAGPFSQLVLAGAGPAETDARLRLSQRDRVVGGSPDELDSPAVLRVGPFELDQHAYTITIDGGPLRLTHHEFELFRALLGNAGRPMSRERLLDVLGGGDSSPRTIDCHVRALRSKLGRHRASIRTIRGLGYLAVTAS
jgi:DNA-binding response OmpR family regulator